MAVLDDLGMKGAFNLAGIAKKDPDIGESDDKIYLPARTNPVQFGRDRDLLLLLQHIRDEAHRWAVSFQRKRRQKRAFQSALDTINGIGPKRKALLLQRFGGKDEIGAASLEELQSVDGITPRLAKTLKETLATHG